MERTWHAVAPGLSSRKVRLDLRGVTFIEPVAEGLLKEIYGQTGAEFQTGSLVTKYLVERTLNGANNSETSAKGNSNEKRCRTSKHE